MNMLLGNFINVYQDTTSHLEVADSIKTTQHSASPEPTEITVSIQDTTDSQIILQDTVEIRQISIPGTDIPSVSIKKKEVELIEKQILTPKKKKIVLERYEKVPDSLSTLKIKRPQSNFIFYSQDSLIFDVKPDEILYHTSLNPTSSVPINFKTHYYQRSDLNWTLIIGFISILLLLFLKTFYRKFLSQVATTIVNFQLADKMLREKNMIVRRAFFLMNLNYILILTLFILLLSIYWEFSFNNSHFIEYLIFLTFVLGIIIIRHVIYYLLGYLFVLPQAITEQIHINYLVNKNVGLFLFPLVFISIFTSPQISKTVLFLGIGVVFLATLYKLIRGFQIILRNGVLILYAILYFCTLELLPLVIGSKLIISLR